MEVEDLVLNFTNRTTTSTFLKGVTSMILKNRKQHSKVISIVKELQTVRISKWTEIQITKFSKQLLVEIGDEKSGNVVLTTIFKISLHDYYRKLMVQLDSWEKLLRILLLTENVTKLIVEKEKTEFPERIILSITDICVGFLNRTEIQNFFIRQGFEIVTESETESCCSSVDSAGSELSVILGCSANSVSTNTPIEIASPIHDIISLASGEEVSSIPETDETDDNYRKTVSPTTTFNSTNTIVSNTFSSSCQTVINQSDIFSNSQLILPIVDELDLEEVGINMSFSESTRKRHFKGSPGTSGLSTPKRHASSSQTSEIQEKEQKSWNLHNLGTIASIAIVSFGVMMLAKPNLS